MPFFNRCNPLSIYVRPDLEIIPVFERKKATHSFERNSLKGRASCLLAIIPHLVSAVVKPVVYSALAVVGVAVTVLALLAIAPTGLLLFGYGYVFKEEALIRDIPGVLFAMLVIPIGVTAVCVVDIAISPIAQLILAGKAAAGVIHPGAYFQPRDRHPPTVDNNDPPYANPAYIPYTPTPPVDNIDVPQVYPFPHLGVTFAMYNIPNNGNPIVIQADVNLKESLDKLRVIINKVPSIEHDQKRKFNSSLDRLMIRFDMTNESNNRTAINKYFTSISDKMNEEGFSEELILEFLVLLDPNNNGGGYMECEEGLLNVLIRTCFKMAVPPQCDKKPMYFLNVFKIGILETMVSLATPTNTQNWAQAINKIKEHQTNISNKLIGKFGDLLGLSKDLSDQASEDKFANKSDWTPQDFECIVQEFFNRCNKDAFLDFLEFRINEQEMKAFSSHIQTSLLQLRGNQTEQEKDKFKADIVENCGISEEDVNEAEDDKLLDVVYFIRCYYSTDPKGKDKILLTKKAIETYLSSLKENNPLTHFSDVVGLDEEIQVN